MKKLTFDHLSSFMEYGVELNTRTIYMGSFPDDEVEEVGVDFRLAERVIKALHVLENISDDQITILINNHGGDDTQMSAIYDAISICKSKIKAIVLGQANSAASIILQAADERVLSPHSTVMIHHGNQSWAENHHKSIQRWVAYTKKFNKRINKIYLDKIQEKHPNFNQKKLDQLLEFDTPLTPEETIDLGLADRLLEEGEFNG